MKAEILGIDGKKIKEIELPSVFSETIRQDIIQKTFESEKKIQPYFPNTEAGKKHSASGRIRHIRHKWRTAYGRGISRIPRKTMWRRGTQFYWIGAEISGTRGGRRAHPPKLSHFLKENKINKKEYNIALRSAFSSTANENLVKNNYERLSNSSIKIGKLPIIIESRVTELKTNNLIDSLKKILGNMSLLIEENKKVRVGKGKMRNRLYKKYRGILIITGNKEEIKTKAIDNKKIKDIKLNDLYPLGRFVIYTENAIKDLEDLNIKNKVK